MSTTVEAMVEGGKATAGPPIGPALGPLGVNIGEVINSINQKTQAFKGMKVPVKIIVQQDKSFNIEVGTPPVSQLITKELGIEKGSGTPNSLKVGNMAVEQVIKVAAMKKESMFVNSLKSAVKSVAGSAHSMGVLVEGKISSEFNKDVESGIYDNEIKTEKTEFSEEKKLLLQTQLEQIQKEIQKELERIKAQEEAEKAKEEAAKAPVAGAEEVKVEEKVEEKIDDKDVKKEVKKEEKKEVKKEKK